MSKYIQFALVIAYACLTVSSVFLVIEVFGAIHTRHPDLQFLLVIAGWSLICLSVAFILSDCWLLFQEVRNPVREEEEKFSRCLSMLPISPTRYRLRIEEENSFNAFAVGRRTIVVSAGLLQELPEDELAAVLAHEVGHLITKDCMAGMAYICATYVPRKLSFILKIGLKVLSRMVLKGIAQGIAGLAVVCFLLFYFHILLYAIAIVVLIMLISGLDAVFGYLWLLNCRRTEYRQDAFVHHLGLGRELRRVLLKINNSKPQKVSFFYTLRSTHPILFNRVRRLERLEASEQPLEIASRSWRDRA
jgi:Zn-dependent protease with chaperone function